MTAWTCPRCRKPFDIPEGWQTPKMCNQCLQEVRQSGPPKPPIPPKPVAAPLEIEADEIPASVSPPKFSPRRLAWMVAGLFLVILVSAVAAVGIQQNQAFEEAQRVSRELNRKQDEIVAERRAATLERLAGPPVKPAIPVKCKNCGGEKKIECDFCLDGKIDCSACSDGTVNYGTHIGKCPICKGKEEIICSHCDGVGWKICTHCDGSGLE